MNVKVGDDVFTIAWHSADHLPVTRKLSHHMRHRSDEDRYKYVHDLEVKWFKKLPDDFWDVVLCAFSMTKPNRNGDAFSIDAALNLASEYR